MQHKHPREHFLMNLHTRDVIILDTFSATLECDREERQNGIRKCQRTWALMITKSLDLRKRKLVRTNTYKAMLETEQLIQDKNK